MPNDGRHSASPGPLFVRKFALDQFIVVVPHTGYNIHPWELIFDIRKPSSHYHQIIRHESVPLYECSHGCFVIACPFCLCLQPRGLPAVATRMSSSAEWMVCVYLCDGAVMETRTAWTWATRRTARASHTCATLLSSLPARTQVGSRLAILNFLTHISATIIKKCQDTSKD